MDAIDYRIPASAPYFKVNVNGVVVNVRTGKTLTPCGNGHGYFYVSKYAGNGVTKHHYIHRLVAECFIQNTYNLPEVNHKDGNKSNNASSNLEWCDRAGNMRHAYQTGLKPNTTEKQRAAARMNAKNSKARMREGWARWSVTEKAKEQWIRNLGIRKPKCAEAEL